MREDDEKSSDVVEAKWLGVRTYTVQQIGFSNIWGTRVMVEPTSVMREY